MSHTYGVPHLWCPIKAEGKGRTVNRREKGPEARESSQTVKEEQKGLDLGPLQERLRMPHSAPGGGGCSLAELLEA